MKKYAVLLWIMLMGTIFLSACDLAIPVFKEAEADPAPSSVMFLGGSEDINIGELYCLDINGEKERIAETAQKDEFVIAPQSQNLLVLNKENELYLYLHGQDKIKIAGGAVKSSFCFSEDETAIAYLVETTDEGSAEADFYVQKIGAEKEKVASGLSKENARSNYSLADNGSSGLFVTADNSLYSWSTGSNKEKLAGEVKAFTSYADTAAYSYINTDGIYYVKFSNDSEAQRISVTDIGNLRVTPDGLMALFTGGYNWERDYGELYAVIKGGDSVKLASNVRSFHITANGRLYYLNDESSVYLKKLPRIHENTYKNLSKFTDEISKGDKTKVCSDVARLAFSPNGKNSAFIDHDGNLYLSYDEKEKIKVSSDITDVRVFDNSLLFENKDSQLFLNSILKDTDHIKQNNKMIAQLLTNFMASENGKYICFTTSEDQALNLIVDGGAPLTLVDDCTQYDMIILQNQVIYEKKLMLADIAGIYKNKELGAAYKITDDGQFLLYEKGEEKENSKISITGLNRLSAELKSDNQDSVLAKNNVIFSVSTEGTKSLVLSDAQYTLEVIDEEGLETEIQRQKKAEADAKAAAERKAAAEKAAAELKIRKEKAEERGKTYLRNGVYVTSYQTLYYSPNYSSASRLTVNSSGLKSVYDYAVSSDGNTVWLKLYTTASSYDGYTGYVWVAE